jgi:hypothetical protein
MRMEEEMGKEKRRKRKEKRREHGEDWAKHVLLLTRSFHLFTEQRAEAHF